MEEEFGQFGPIDSMKLFPHKHYGLVNFASKEDAMEAFHNISKVSISGQELKAKAPTFKKAGNSTAPSTGNSSSSGALIEAASSPMTETHSPKPEVAPIEPKKEIQTPVSPQKTEEVPLQKNSKSEVTKRSVTLTKSKIQYLLKFYKELILTLKEEKEVVELISPLIVRFLYLD